MGLADIVGIVLSLSRLHVAFGMASGALRVAREAILYSLTVVHLISLGTLEMITIGV